MKLRNLFLLFLMLMNISVGIAAIGITPVTAKWRTYRNTKYGFEIKLPPNAQMQKQTSLSPSNNWRIDADIGNAPSFNAKGKQILSILLFKTENRTANPVYFLTGLNIGVSDDPANVKNCIRNSESMIKINGITFHTFSIEDAGMQQYLSGVSYRTVHDHKCYVLDQLRRGATPYIYPTSSKDIPESVLDDYYNQVNNIVRTFKFINRL